MIGGNIIKSNIKEGIEGYHIVGHVVCPFQHLGADVDEEGVGTPASQDHDFGGRVVFEEKGHRCPGANGAVADFRSFESKGLLATEQGARGSEKVECVGGIDVGGCASGLAVGGA